MEISRLAVGFELNLTFDMLIGNGSKVPRLCKNA